MAYTPIDWDETVPINPDNLNKMDEEIDSNEQRISDVEDGSNPVALAEALTSDFSGIQITGGDRILDEDEAANINLPFTADYVMSNTTSDRVDVGESGTEVFGNGSKFLTDVDTIKIENNDNGRQSYSYIAIKINN